ncbi:hypothetical protein [Parabacteroides sp.]|uniref:hypothetical protein n=1 Tax=Parabacteroides sp. TaxID=1869337 RepID=UPI00257F87EE|nr:hypothetical protein [Parabacteroides sp.]
MDLNLLSTRERDRIEELKWDYENAMYRYRQYKEDSEKEFDQADTELRYADDYDRKYYDYKDDSYRNYANECRSNAQSRSYEGRQLAAEAQRYYEEAQEYKRDLSSMGIYV